MRHFTKDDDSFFLDISITCFIGMPLNARNNAAQFTSVMEQRCFWPGMELFSNDQMLFGRIVQHSLDHYVCQILHVLLNCKEYPLDFLVIIGIWIFG